MLNRLVWIVTFTVFVVLLAVPATLNAEEGTKWNFPDFKLENLKGNKVTDEEVFADTDLVLIDFFTYYCKPCKKLMPFISGFQEKYGDYGFKAVLFDEDEPEGIPLTRSYLKQQGFIFDVLFDIEGKVESFYSTVNHPTTILMDGTGKVLLRHEGYNKGDEEELENFIKDYLVKIGNMETDGSSGE